VSALGSAPGAAAQGGVTAPDLSDPCPAVYPGDSASRERLARWMARGAADRGLPRELPVMAAIAESGVRNLSGQDYHGFFGMHESLSAGVYRGFPTRPTLQLRWFLDSAGAVRQRRIAEGLPDPAADAGDYGLWVADVERPAPQNRSGYQPHLAEARRLVGSRCPEPVTSDAAPPPLSVRIARRQRVVAGALSVRLRCPQEGCRIGAVLGVEAGGQLRERRASADSPADGDWIELAVAVPRSARRQLARGRSVPAVVRAIGVSESARATIVERQVRLLP
jgi:hypothetical protein